MSRSLEVRTLHPRHTAEVVAYLRQHTRANLFLIDLVARCGAPPMPGEMRSEIAVATRDGRLVGVVALRPSIVLDVAIEEETIEAFAPFIDSIDVGLVKSDAAGVEVLWDRLEGRRRRRTVIDRYETAYMMGRDAARFVESPVNCRSRGADTDDLESLVYAARESLREEHRPDPFSGDVRGFRKWVGGRVQRARVVDHAGRIVFVGYADVQRPDGWLLQGIYTWPDVRRRGVAASGTSDLCRRAFDDGADHVQLAVVEGNEPARSLYEGLGFKPFGRLRTILFH